MKKTILGVLVALCLVVGMAVGLSPTAQAADTWSYPTSTPVPTWSGDGTASTPFSIVTAQQLADLAYLVNNGVTYGAGQYYADAYYSLGETIDLNNQEWTPIGYDNAGYTFNGRFDGNGKMILNLKISTIPSTMSALTGGQTSAGLFGATSGATLCNIYLLGATIQSNVTCVGSLVGTTGYWCSDFQEKTTRPFTSLDNCVVKNASVTGGRNSMFVGGVAGMANNLNQITISSTAYSGPESVTHVNGGAFTGGIAGFTIGNVTKCEVLNAEVRGLGTTGGVVGGARLPNRTTLFAYNNAIGDVIGYADDDFYDVVFVDMFGASSYACVGGVGGVVGVISTSGTALSYMMECSFIGDVLSKSLVPDDVQEYYMHGTGGLVGAAIQIFITDCFCPEGTVKAEYNVGGLVGTSVGSDLRLSYCYASNQVALPDTSESTSETPEVAGALIGYYENTSFACCFFHDPILGAYGAGMFSSPNEYEYMDDTDLGSGIVCERLNDSRTPQVWAQDVSMVPFPVFYEDQFRLTHVHRWRATSDISLTTNSEHVFDVVCTEANCPLENRGGKLTIHLPIDESGTAPYNGKKQGVTLSYSYDWALGNDPTITYSDSDIVSVGQNVTATITFGHLCGFTIEENYTISRRTLTNALLTSRTVTYEIDPMMFNGQSQTPTGYVRFWIDATNYESIEGTFSTVVGTTDQTIFTPDSTSNFTGQLSLPTGMQKLNLALTTVQLAPSPVYDGTPQTQQILSVTVNGAIVPESLYKVTGNTQTEVGVANYTLRIEPNPDDALAAANVIGFKTEEWNLRQSGSSFVSGTVSNHSLIYGEILHVNAVVQATGSPAEPSVTSLTPPTGRQMALFVETTEPNGQTRRTQISEAVSQTESGYLLTYDTTTKRLSPGTHKIVAAFIGDASQTGCEYAFTIEVRKRTLMVTGLTLADRVYEAGNTRVTATDIVFANVAPADTALIRMADATVELGSDAVGTYTSAALTNLTLVETAVSPFYTFGLPIIVQTNVSILEAEPEIDYAYLYMLLQLLYNKQFEITASASDGGEISADGVTLVRYNKSMTYTFTPDTGYEIADVLVDGKSVGVVSSYTFEHVRQNHTIHVIFVRSAWENPFSDVTENDWYYEAIRFAQENGLMEGVDAENNRFVPEGTIDRAALLTILWKLYGAPVVDFYVDYSDFTEGETYSEAIRWACAAGLLNGMGDGALHLHDALTREQFATILYRYIQYRGGGFTGLWMYRMDYTDLADVSDWAYEAISYLTMHNLLAIHEEGMLSAKENALRADVAAFLYHFCKMIESGMQP